jgi:preprotein translocase subunit SecD
MLSLIPSLVGSLPSWWPKVLPSEKIHFGLDLCGGTYVLLEVEIYKAVGAALGKYARDIQDVLSQDGIRFDQVETTADGRILVRLPDDKANSRFIQIRSSRYANLNVASIRKQGGKFLYTLEMNDKEAKDIEKSAARRVLETIRNRIDQFGVSEPVIVPQGETQIVVQLPGIKEPRRAIELIGRTALLEFKLVDEDHDVEDAIKGNMPPGDEILYQKVMDKGTGVMTQRPFLLKRNALMTGDVLTNVHVRVKSNFNEPYILMNFNASGAHLFDQITAEHAGKYLAIVLDSNVYAAPFIQERVSNGQCQITGDLTIEKAYDLAIVLRAGALPAPVRVIENVVVGPALGRDSIDKAIRAGAIGVVMVAVFMAFCYGMSGLIADTMLLFNAVFLLGALALMHVTLTLPGIAGVILAIGMAVDSNVLLFERIRDELRLGKTAQAAVDSGYNKALFTIIDSHVTTLITALVLFQFGTGPIRGFANTLSLGVIINLFSSLVGTKLIFDWINMGKQIKTLSIKQFLRL